MYNIYLIYRSFMKLAYTLLETSFDMAPQAYLTGSLMIYSFNTSPAFPLRCLTNFKSYKQLLH
jgi:hypothetical protein